MGNFMSTPFAIVIPAGCLCYLLVWAFENNNNLIRPSVGGVPAPDAYGTCRDAAWSHGSVLGTPSGGICGL